MGRVEPDRRVLMTRYRIALAIVQIRHTIQRILPARLTQWIQEVPTKRVEPFMP